MAWTFYNSDGQRLVKQSSSGGGGVSLSGSTNNTITTVTGACAIQGEADLTFDGTTLSILSDTGTGNTAGLNIYNDGAASACRKSFIRFAQNRTTGGETSTAWIYGNLSTISCSGYKGDLQLLTACNGAPSLAMKLQSCGAVLKPATPAFLARNSAKDCNVTGNGTIVTVDFNPEVFDQGANFACDVFTAPVTGRYLMTTIVEYQGNTTCHNRRDVWLYTSNRNYGTVMNGSRTGTVQQGLSMIVDMDACDTAYVRGNVYDGGQVIDIASCGTYFSGALIA